MSDKYYIVNPTWQASAGNDFKTYTEYLHGIAQEIEIADPAKVYIFSCSEMDIETIYQPLFDLLIPWLTRTSKQIELFTANVPFDYAIEYMPHINWHQCHAYDIINFFSVYHYYEDKQPIATNPTKLFTSYNNRPNDYRTYLIDQFAKHGLLNDGIVTYRFATQFGMDKLEDTFTYYRGMPLLQDEPDFILNSKIEYRCNNLPKSFLKGAIDIVTESRIDPGEFYMSEKTCKPIMTQKPFLVLSSQHYHKWLQDEFGIEPYDEIFNYKFDSFPRYTQRAIGIVENLLKLREQYRTPDDYKHLLQMLKPKLEHNVNVYMKKILEGSRVFANLPDWFTLPTDEVSNLFLRGCEDLHGEAYAIHEFLHHVIQNPNFKLPDFSA